MRVVMARILRGSGHYAVAVPGTWPGRDPDIHPVGCVVDVELIIPLADGPPERAVDVVHPGAPRSLGTFPVCPRNLVGPRPSPAAPGSVRRPAMPIPHRRTRCWPPWPLFLLLAAYLAVPPGRAARRRAACCRRGSRPRRPRPRTRPSRPRTRSTATPAPAGPARTPTRSGSRWTWAPPPTIDQVMLNWEAAYARRSRSRRRPTATTWTTIYSTTTGTGGTQTLPSPAAADTSGCTAPPGHAYGYSLWEFQVFGT